MGTGAATEGTGKDPALGAGADTSVEAERAAAIAALEQSASRRRFGIRWTTALFGILMGLLGLWWQSDDLAYFFSTREPITLGTEGDYHFDRLRTNRYAQIHGIPTTRAAFSREGDVTFVHVGLQGTPVIVRRAALPTEDWVPGRPPTAPDQRPFGVRGRLLAEEDAGPFSEAFTILRRQEGMIPVDGRLWLLEEGARPGEVTGSLGISVLLLAFVGVNVWFLVRDLRSRRRIARAAGS